MQALREQLTAAQDAAYSATARLQAEQQQAVSAREALMQARAEADTLRVQVVDLQSQQAGVLAETQSRHAAQERRWLNELDAERQATKRLGTDAGAAPQTGIHPPGLALAMTARRAAW
ncbi:MAG TPA: hypothetical protein VL522_01940 [Bordetella sp.]|nr:hypothetical protein [Bordetella sp.]